MANIPSYYPTPALDFLAEWMEDDKHLEWVVAAWATTMLKKVFSDDKWIIVPERTNEDTKKRPDLTVQEMNTPYLLYELKTKKGGRLEDALIQTVEKILPWVDGITKSASIYVIIQRDHKIAFFEYHGNAGGNDYTTHRVPHIHQCVSLTQPLPDRVKDGSLAFRSPITDIPETVLPLYYDHENLTRMDPNRDEAMRYTERCVFDIREHKKEINLLFHYISTNEPREGPREEDSYGDTDED